MTKAKAYSIKRGHTRTSNSRLPLFLLIGGAVLLLVAVFFTFQKKPAPYMPVGDGSPILQVDKETVDLGNEKLGTFAQVSFKITNAGNQPLRFSKAPYVEVKQGC
jgi:hypothetical protein